MGKSQRDKGKRGERAVAGFLTDAGWPTRRSVQFNGRDPNAVSDLIVDGLPQLAIEVKFRQAWAVDRWLQRQKDECRDGQLPMLFCKKTTSRWWLRCTLKTLSNSGGEISRDDSNSR